MRFDRTDGKKAKYMVNVYEGNTEDHYYFHYYKDADKFFVGLMKVPHESGTCINIYDLQKEIQIKLFRKIFNSILTTTEHSATIET